MGKGYDNRGGDTNSSPGTARILHKPLKGQRPVISRRPIVLLLCGETELLLPSVPLNFVGIKKGAPIVNFNNYHRQETVISRGSIGVMEHEL